MGCPSPGFALLPFEVKSPKKSLGIQPEKISCVFSEWICSRRKAHFSSQAFPTGMSQLVMDTDRQDPAEEPQVMQPINFSQPACAISKKKGN